MWCGWVLGDLGAIMSGVREVIVQDLDMEGVEVRI